MFKPLPVNNYAIKKYHFDEYVEEISDYVINDVAPQSERLIKIISEFEELHKNSGREIYK
jgi:hypothetical protein